jgi:hypothetical protein
LRKVTWQFKTKNLSRVPSGIFTLSEIKTEIFQAASPLVWAKLWRRSYIEENNLRFLSLDIGEDYVFTYMAMTENGRVAIYDEPLLCYRKYQNSNSVHRRRYFSQENIKHQHTLKAYLEQRELLVDLKETYTKRTLSDIYSQTTMLQDMHEYEKLSKYYRESGFNELSITRDEVLEYCVARDKELYEAIVTNSPCPFALTRELRLVDRNDILRQKISKLRAQNATLRERKDLFKKNLKIANKNLRAIKASRSYRYAKKLKKLLHPFKSKKK